MLLENNSGIEGVFLSHSGKTMQAKGKMSACNECEHCRHLIRLSQAPKENSAGNK